jgi:hypothetical protein
MMFDQVTRDLTPEEEQSIAEFMGRLAQTAHDSDALPPAHVLWWKAQLLRRWEAERRATLPLDAVEPLQVLSGVASAALLLIWMLPVAFGVETGVLERAFQWAVAMLERL